MSLRDGAQDDVYEVLLRDRLYEYYTVNIEKDPYSHGVLKLLEQTMTKHQALLTYMRWHWFKIGLKNNMKLTS